MPTEPRVIQVSNVAPVATRDQMKTLFNFIGKIDDLVLYPETEPNSSSTRVCYVKFTDPEDVGVALHLTNTVFIDRALIIVPVPDGRIPDEKTALGSQNGLGLYPALPASTELSKVDEIRRTVYIANIDAAVSPEALMQYFGTHAGEVKYARMAGDENYAVHAAFIEFTEQVSVMRAIGLTGQVLGSRAITVVPANTAIVKSSTASLGATSSREIEEAMRKVNEAQPLIDAVLASEGDRRRSSRSRSRRSRSHRSRSPKRSRSRGSRSHRRSRSRSHKSRRRSSSRSPRRRSPSPRFRRSRSRSFSRKHSSHRSKSPSSHKSRRERRGPDEFGNRSPMPPGDRRSSRDEMAKFRRRMSHSRSRSPMSRGPRRDRDPNMGRERMDRDHMRGKERSSHRDPREQRGDRKVRGSDEKGKRDRDGERKPSSSRRHREKEEKKALKAKARAQEEDEEEEEEEEEEEQAQEEVQEAAGSDYEQQLEEQYEQSESEENQSGGDEPARGDESPGGANLSRLDMDVDSE